MNVFLEHFDDLFLKCLNLKLIYKVELKLNQFLDKCLTFLKHFLKSQLQLAMFKIIIYTCKL